MFRIRYTIIALVISIIIHNSLIIQKTYAGDISQQFNYGLGILSCEIELKGDLFIGVYNSLCSSPYVDDGNNTKIIGYKDEIEIEKEVEVQGQVVYFPICYEDLQFNDWFEFAKHSNSNFIIDDFIKGGKLKIKNNTFVVIPPGVYYFEDVEISGKAKVEFIGPTTIVVKNDFKIKGESEFNPSGDPSNLEIIVGEKYIMSGKSRLYGFVISKKAKIKGESIFVGSIISEEFESKGNSKIYFDKSLSVSKVKIFPNISTISVGETFQFSASAYNNYNEIIECAEFEWESSNDLIATHISNGIFIGNSTGNTQIIAMEKRTGIADTAILVVNEPKSPPVLQFSAFPTYGEVPLPVTFTVYSFDPDGGELLWGRFDADGDGTWEMNSYLGTTTIYATFEWVYNQTGTFFPKIEIMDDEGTTISKSLTITVIPKCIPQKFWIDKDNDGYGDPNIYVISCSKPQGYSTNALDCNDNDPNTNPNSQEICDGIDNNCNGSIDEGIYFPFSKIIGNYREDGSDFIIGLDNSRFIVGGRTIYNNTYNAYIFSVDSNGTIIWEKIIGSNGYSIVLRDGVKDTLGNIVVVGYISKMGSSDIIVLKITPAGDIIWTKTVGNVSSNEMAYSITQDTEGNYIILGSIEENGDTNIYIVKLSQNGNIIWAKSIGGNSIEVSYSIIANKNNEYITAGYIKDPLTGHMDIIIIRIDKYGNIIWIKQIGGTNDDFASQILELPFNEYIVIGGTKSFSINNDYDIYILRIDSTGNIHWNKSIGGNSDEIAKNAILDVPSQEIIVGGYSKSFLIHSDSFILEMSLSGVLKWFKMLNIKGYDGIDAILPIDTGFILTGGTYINQTSNELDIFIMKMTQGGCVCSGLDFSPFVSVKPINMIEQSIILPITNKNAVANEINLMSIDISYNQASICQ